MSTKDKVTKAQVDSILAEFRRNGGVKTKTQRRQYNPLSYSTHSLKGDLTTTVGSKGEVLHRAKKGAVITDPNTIKYLERAKIADAQSAALGEPRKHHNSLFNRTVDVLSRGMFASANAVKVGDAIEQEQRAKGHHGKGVLKGLAAMPGAFWQGLSGKKKTTFHDVLDQSADEEYARKNHILPSQAKGKGKKGGFLRGAEGLFLDVALDPTTYMGVGLGTKAVTKSKNIVGNVNKVAKLQADVAASAKAPLSTVRTATASHNIPIDSIKKKHLKLLTPEGKDLYGHIVSTKSGSTSRFADKLTQKFKPSTNAHTRRLFEGATDEHMSKAIHDALDEQMKKYPGLNGYIDHVTAMGTKDSKGVLAWANPDHAQINIERPLHTHAAADAVRTEELGSNWASFAPKTTEEFAKGVVVHEVGHHVAYAMPEKVMKSLWDKVVSMAPKDVINPHNMQTVKALKYVFSKKKLGDAIHLDEIKKLAPGKTQETYSKIWRKLIEDGHIHPISGWDATVAGHGADIAKTFEKFANPDIPYHVQDFLTKNLSEYGGTKNFHETLAEAWAEAHMSSKPRPLAKMLASEMEKYVPKGPTLKDTQEILRQLADDSALNALKQGGDLFAKDVPQFEKVSGALHEELLAATARNLSPKIKKEFQLKIGPTSVGIPLVAESVGKGFQRLGTIPGIKQSVDGFNKLFRASAHIPAGLNHIRQNYTGNTHQFITEHAKLLQSWFQGTTKEEREALMSSLRSGAVIGNKVKGGLDEMGLPINDLMAKVAAEVHALNESFKNSGISVKEINDFLADKYKIVDQRIHAGKQFVGDTATVRKVTIADRTPDFMWETLKNNKRINDPAHFLYLYTAALNQAIARKNMWETVAQTWGVPKGDLSKELIRKHGWTEAGLKHTKDFVFQPEISHAMNRMNEVFTNERSTGEFLNHFDQALRGFKAVVTKFNPSFHSRTFLGEMLLGYMGGMKNLPRSYKKAGQVIHGRSQEFLGQGTRDFGAGKTLVNAANKVGGHRAYGPTTADGSRTIMRMRNGTNLSADQIWHYFEDTGLKTGFVSTDLAKGPTDVLGAKLKTTRDMANRLTEGVEDYGRLAHFIDVLSHTNAKNLDDAIQEAAQTVRKYHLDYTNVTKFERSVMTRLVPFYKWMRLSTPVMAEILLTQPGKALLVPKTLRAISEMAGYDTSNFGVFPGGPDAAVPEWLRDHGAMPWATIAGNTNYFDPTAIFPLAGSAELADGGASRTLNPLLKLTSDMVHGSDNLGNQLSANPTEGDMPHYLASQLPQTNFAEQMITHRDPGIPRWQTLAQFLSNPGNQPNTQKRMRGEAFRQQQDAYHHRKEVKKKKGVKP